LVARYSYSWLKKALRGDIPLDELRAEAHRAKLQALGRRVTYVHNRNANFTNICVIDCRFCAFYRRREDPEAYTHSIEEVLRRVASTPEITEVCLQGGINPYLPPEYYLDLLRRLRAFNPNLHLHAFSPQEVHILSLRWRTTVADALKRLRDAGLDSMPGTAAEILVDEVRRRICPEKISTARWREIVETAHRLGIPTSSTMMFGHVEGPEDRAAHLKLLRDIQESTGGFTEFIALPFMPYNTRLGRSQGIASPPSVEDYYRLLAAARLYLGDVIPHIQASWVKMGVRVAQGSLHGGVDDFSGTIHEERITSSAGGRHGQGLTRETIRRLISEAGMVPVERDTVYNLREPLPEAVYQTA
jgi:7,8-didemethyl-8-hydroxy-5-deazariboflavin synthase CofH subunit